MDFFYYKMHGLFVSSSFFGCWGGRGASREGFSLIEIQRQDYGTSKSKKCNKRNFTLSSNRMNLVRAEYTPWSIEGKIEKDLDFL